MVYWFNEGFYFNEKPDENAILLTDEEYYSLMDEIGNGGELLQDEGGKPYIRKTEESERREIENLRLMRENHCFSVINRGQFWYDTLSDNQQEELRHWYQEWLDVTETKIIPEKPEWLT